MEHDTSIIQVGPSLYVRIPAKMARRLSIRPNDNTKMLEPDKDGMNKIIISLPVSQ